MFDNAIEPVDTEPTPIPDRYELDIGEIYDQLNLEQSRDKSTKELVELSD